MKYLVALSAVVEVDAENVAQAENMVRNGVRVIGERIGWRTTKNDRDGSSYKIKIDGVTYGKPRKVET